jgi:tetratricopeptide (TPR) repeat protein
VALFRQALEHDPLNLLARRYLARTLSFAGRLAEAEIEIRQVLDTNPAQPGAHYDLGRILVAKGEIDAAGAAFEAETDASWKGIGLPLKFHAQQRTAEANAALATLVKNSSGAEFQVAEAYADFGDTDQAFKWLDAAAESDSGIIWLHNDPLFKGLRSDPRYAMILRKLKMTK